MSRLDQIIDERMKKVKTLQDMGIDPYPSFCGERISVSEALRKVGNEVSVAGRLMSLRGHGKLIFTDLKDESGQMQLMLKADEMSGNAFQLVKLLDIGDFVWAKGEMGKSKAGELSVIVRELKLLTKAIRPLPEKWHGLRDVEERYRQRYVDLLMNKEVRDVVKKRSQIVTELRNFMDDNQFLEVETPILQSVYGGATAKPFITHHNSLDSNFYLRISDELFLKRLIVAGFEKVYEIGHNFRNEGIDKSHNPEFTMMEFYWAYADYEELMKFSEKIITRVIKLVNNQSLKVRYGDKVLDFSLPWQRIAFRDILFNEAGVDIDIASNEDKLKEAMKGKNLKLDLKGVIGYGALCDKLYKEVVRPRIIQPTLLLDYPSEMIALAKRKSDNKSKIASFQLLANGAELIKAYNELNDPVDQRERWLDEEKLGEAGLEEHMVVDDDYIRALEYGMPPTAGWGLGIDRLIAFLTNQPTLKDVILFPTLRPVKD